MSASFPTSSRAWVLAAFIGFLVLFSAVSAGWDYFGAGREKASNPAWTGATAGTGIAGFLKGANTKATKSPTNTNPEVMPLMRELNGFFAQQTAPFAWLVVLGELLMPIGVLLLLIVRFTGSKYLLIFVTALAAFMNFVYLSEGTSSSNVPMVFMWLAVVWLTATLPAAALFYAIDLRPAAHRTDTFATLDTSSGQWLFFGATFLVVLGGSAAMYDGAPMFGVLAVAAVLAAILYTLKSRVLGKQIMPRPTTAPQPAA